jgi:hypothetical protein
MMSPWEYWPLVALVSLTAVSLIGMVQFLLWVMAIELYTRLKYPRRVGMPPAHAAPYAGPRLSETME